jgi:hypothetical protein
MLRVVRLVRVFRIIGLILKLGKYSQGARVLALTVTACVRELVILAVCLALVQQWHSLHFVHGSW